MPIEQTDKEIKQPQEKSKLLTAEQVAEIICCSPKTIYAWAELGYIPSIKIGAGRKALLRFDQDQVTIWIRQWKEEARTRYNDSAETVAYKPREGGIRKNGHI
jgi:excisionase family DNA binding protein